MKEFDYYLFVDYSENLIGYCIIEHERLKELVPKITKFSHYKFLRHKRAYIQSIKKIIEKDNLKSYFLKIVIKELYKNTDVYVDILEFIKKSDNCIIFISVDNRQYKAFNRLVGFVDRKKVVVKKESDLLLGTPEYRASLVLDTLLNIERLAK